MRIHEHILLSLQGDWQISRIVDNYGTMSGHARFQMICENTLYYREEGVLTLISGVCLTVFQKYYYVLGHKQIRIAFAGSDGPGATFHMLHFIKNAPDDCPTIAQDSYKCGSDIYSGDYCFESHDKFTICMRIEGPSKAFCIHTMLFRIGSRSV